MPPVLNVTLCELARRSPQEVFSSNFTFSDAESHPILELVAEPIRSAHLVEGRASPDATTQRLVKQPAIHQNIHRPLRRGDLYTAEHVVPPGYHLTQHRVEVSGAIGFEQLARLFFIS